MFRHMQQTLYVYICDSCLFNILMQFLVQIMLDSWLTLLG